MDTIITPDNLTVISWSINGYRATYIDINDLIREHNPDIIALQETKLNHDHRASIAGYIMNRYDRRVNRGGGLALLIKNNLTYFHHEPQKWML